MPRRSARSTCVRFSFRRRARSLAPNKGASATVHLSRSGRWDLTMLTPSQQADVCVSNALESVTGALTMNPRALSLPNGITLRAPRVEGDEEVLTEAALAFLADLERTFGARIEERMAKRRESAGRPMHGSRCEFGLSFFLTAKAKIERGSGPYYYLPKMESHLEARIWNDVFVQAQSALGIPNGTIKATVLIETLPAAFEMDEILYELRDHSSGLNCGRWDY